LAEKFWVAPATLLSDSCEEIPYPEKYSRKVISQPAPTEEWSDFNPYADLPIHAIYELHRIDLRNRMRRHVRNNLSKLAQAAQTARNVKLNSREVFVDYIKLNLEGIHECYDAVLFHSEALKLLKHMGFAKLESITPKTCNAWLVAHFAK